MTGRRIFGGKACGRLVALLCLLGLSSPVVSWATEPGAKDTPVPPVQQTRNPAVVLEERNTQVVTAPPADLVVANRKICTLRATVFGVHPEQRVKAILVRGRELLERGGPLKVTTRPVAGGVAIQLDGQTVFVVFDSDVLRERGESAQAAAEVARENLQLALREMSEARDFSALLPALLRSLGYTALLVGCLWILRRVYGWMVRRLDALSYQRLARLVPEWGDGVIRRQEIARMVRLPLTLLAWLIGLLLAYQWIARVLREFPYTRPWGEALFNNLVEALVVFGSGILGAIPGLLFVVLIFAIARIVVRLTNRFFSQVQAGRIQTGWLDETTARPTGQLVKAVIWLFAFVAAYPYIPGSGSEAFQGIGVFVGLMLSIGASGIVNQAVSGLMLMYTRSLRPGEFVKVGETEGKVRSIGFLTTRIETINREEVSIPNAVIASNVTRNFSRLASEHGLFLSAQLTVGYDTPWRQVEAMLLMAAARTPGADSEPPPRVLQTGLLDYYVEYKLLVAIHDASQRVQVLHDLHRNILDVFNEFGVQITSPNYESDPEQAKIVPPEDWYRAPARPPGALDEGKDQPA